MLKIKVKTGNAAFFGPNGEEEDRFEECARILEDAALKLRQGNTNFILNDINGNLVGQGTLTKR